VLCLRVPFRRALSLVIGCYSHRVCAPGTDDAGVPDVHGHERDSARYLYTVRRDRFAAFRAKLVDRGAFLLVVAHLLILVPKAVVRPDIPPHTWILITDVIGLSLVTIPWLVPKTSRAARLWLGVLMYAISLWLRDFVSQGTGSWPFVRGLLWGGPPEYNAGQLFPVMAWIPVYLMGTVLGEHIALWRAAGGDRRVMVRLAWLGGVMIAASLLAWRLVRAASASSEGSWLFDWTSPWHSFRQLLRTFSCSQDWELHF